jgi:hypothetical protein
VPSKPTLDSMTSGKKAAPQAPPADPDGITESAAGWRATYTTEADFDPGELSTSYISIAQALSPEVREKRAQEGQIMVTGMAPVASAILVIAGYAPKRAYIPPGGNRAQCRSEDRVLGIGEPGTLQAPEPPKDEAEAYTKGPDGLWHLKCAACPFSQWTDSGRKDPNTGKTINNPPPCAEVDSFLCYSITHGMPVLWNLKGSAARTGRFIKTLATGLGFGQFAVELTSETQTNQAKQSWKVPKAVLAMDGLTVEECAAYAAIALNTQKTSGALTASGGEA